jgi:hypothetical protein
MTLDDGTTEGQADAHAFKLGGVEHVEEPVGAVRLDADADVLDGEAHLIVCVEPSRDDQLPRAILHGAHGVHSVAEQVHDHLLKLYTVAADRRQFVSEFGAQDNAISLKVA